MRVTDFNHSKIFGEEGGKEKISNREICSFFWWAAESRLFGRRKKQCTPKEKIARPKKKKKACRRKQEERFGKVDYFGTSTSCCVHLLCVVIEERNELPFKTLNVAVHLLFLFSRF